MSAGKRLRCNRGFTLIELLTAIVIFALVVSSVYGAYRATFHTIQGTEKQITLAAQARVILERISADLESLYYGKDGYLQGGRGDVNGNRGDNFTCTSSAHLVLNRDERPAGRTVLSYSTEEDENGFINVFRSDRVMMPGENQFDDDDKGLIIGKGLREFKITYITEDGDEQEEWDSEPPETDSDGEEEKKTIRLPAMVRILVGFEVTPESKEQIRFRTAVALPLPVEDAE